MATVHVREDRLSQLGGSAPHLPRSAPAPDLDEELAELRREVERLRGILPERVDVDPEGVEHGLANLVLALVEFLRQLLERQAVRRMEGGTLTDEEVERMGLALMRLEQKMHEMARAFGLDPSELNLGLGPLGRLI